uniref:Uncharacterized protein n=1 Tax=Chromera velia CCMP2878 TaxID=1169474 RepID=A0A0G4FCS3_9ALVE|eukprot:Cvel_3202.t1-p1 / transcript=Cvel_3202.t1 / gene=Cvel_3202 / organism=Chromera_velia_CCMP2878 / gene_product=hypothetical protein / transcript_product=hypothetical protein / location=Cvel_scaffold125:36232-37656(+) / protein_length=475 / sequence_SO=supercontig / SO=protein_coding / is_pseudo=false
MSTSTAARAEKDPLRTVIRQLTPEPGLVFEWAKAGYFGLSWLTLYYWKRKNEGGGRLINVDFSDLPNEYLPLLTRFLPPSVLSVRFKGNRLTQTTGKALSVLSLRHVRLEGCTITPEAARSIFPNLQPSVETFSAGTLLTPPPPAHIRARQQAYPEFFTPSNEATEWSKKVVEVWGVIGRSMESGGLRQLKSLALGEEGAGIDSQAALCVFPFLPPSLESLKLSENGAIDQAGWEALGKRMEGGERKEKEEREGMGGLSQMKELLIDHCLITEKKGRAFMAFLPSSLRVLDLTGNFHLGRYADIFTSFLKEEGELCNLQKLKLEHCGLTDNTASIVFSRLPLTLMTLDVSFNSENQVQPGTIGDAAWGALGKQMQENKLPNLQELIAGSTSLTPHRASSFLFHLPSSLKLLDISGNPEMVSFQDDQWEKVAKQVGGSLTKFLCGSSLSAAQQKKKQEWFPQLENSTRRAKWRLLI